MKIAICISGHVRDYKHFSKFLFERIINKNKETHEIDIFFSTWNTINSNSTFASTRRNFNNYENIDIQDVVKTYSPKLFIVEEENDSLFSKYNDPSHFNNPKIVISQFYKINQVANLLKFYTISTGKKYDLVMKTRFDIEYECTEKIDFTIKDPNIIQKDFKFENLDTSYFHVEPDGSPDNHPYLHDKVFICNQDDYFKFAELYNNFDEMVRESNHIFSEVLIYHWLKKQNLKIRKSFDIRVAKWQST